MTSPSIRAHDVVIVGGRRAGAATALLLARMGHDVALVDRSTFPHRARAAALGDIFAITRELTTFPPLARFVTLQRQLSAAIEREASWLAGLPVPGTADAVAA